MSTSAWNYPQDFMVGINNVGTGWHPLIKSLEEELNTISPGYALQQVKEKFGGLRYYAQPAEGTIDTKVIDSFRAAISRAEEKSTTVCEECGQPGELKADNGWYHTLCAMHRADMLLRKQQEHRDLGGEG